MLYYLNLFLKIDCNTSHLTLSHSRQQADSKQTASRHQQQTKTNQVMANYATEYSTLQKKKVYKAVYNNTAMYIVWLDEIKRDGVDSEGRVRNPMCYGELIYTNQDGLYSVLWNACVAVLQGNYNFINIPRPTEVYYDNKMFNYLQKLKYNPDTRVSQTV